MRRKLGLRPRRDKRQKRGLREHRGGRAGLAAFIRLAAKEAGLADHVWSLEELIDLAAKTISTGMCSVK